MIQINNLEFSYKKNKILFDKLNLEMQAGKIYGLLGKNGAGKTTLLKQIAGLLYPGAGDILINNINSGKRAAEYLSNYYFIPEEFDIPSLTISQYLKIYSPFYPKFNKIQFWDYLKQFDFEEINKLNKLSYGQKKKFILSFGLATNTAILITDEPTNGLDIPSKSKFRKIIAGAVSEERLFIISTHQVRDIEGLIDSVVILENGKIINVKVEYPDDYTKQMIEYGEKYSYLPTYN